MQAVASGTAKVKGISQEIAEKLVRETPAGVRSKFAKLLAKKKELLLRGILKRQKRYPVNGMVESLKR